MDLTAIIQVAIGMIFVWVVLAVITSQVQEWIANVLSMRADMLESAIKQMLGDPTLKDRIYSHPLIKGLHTHDGKRKPAGIPEDKFALVLFEEVMNSGVDVGEVKDTFDKLKKNVAALKTMEGSNELKDFAVSLDTLLIGIEDTTQDAVASIVEARQRVESWFNNSMERLGGAYRRRMQIIAIVVGMIVAGALNVDTAAIMTALWKDPAIRQAVVTQASQVQESDLQAGKTPNYEEIAANVEKLSALSLPIGWNQENIPADSRGWLSKIIGIALSGMAAAQGAPYWFDLMRKLLSRGK